MTAVNNDQAQVTYGDTNTEHESLKDQVEGLAPGELYKRPSDRGMVNITPSVVDPNIGRFTKGTVPENGIGQPIENTQEGISLDKPLFSYEEPVVQKAEKKDAGLTPIQVARQTIRDYDKQQQDSEDDPQDTTQPEETKAEKKQKPAFTSESDDWDSEDK